MTKREANVNELLNFILLDNTDELSEKYLPDLSKNLENLRVSFDPLVNNAEIPQLFQNLTITLKALEASKIYLNEQIQQVNELSGDDNKKREVKDNYENDETTFTEIKTNVIDKITQVYLERIRHRIKNTEQLIEKIEDFMESLDVVATQEI